jgi:hypothetical protein
MLRPVYWQLYATTNPMRDTVSRGGTAAADDESGAVPRSEEEIEGVVLSSTVWSQKLRFALK